MKSDRVRQTIRQNVIVYSDCCYINIAMNYLLQDLFADRFHGDYFYIIDSRKFDSLKEMSDFVLLIKNTLGNVRVLILINNKFLKSGDYQHPAAINVDAPFREWLAVVEQTLRNPPNIHLSIICLLQFTSLMQLTPMQIRVADLLRNDHCPVRISEKVNVNIKTAYHHINNLARHYYQPSRHHLVHFLKTMWG